MTETAETATAAKIPLSESMMGYNATYLHCDVYSGRTNYAVCLHTMKAFREGRITEFMREYCAPAIKARTCPAMKMRAEEVEAGHAIYFSDRRERQKELDAQLSQPSDVVTFRRPKTDSEWVERSRRFNRQIPTPVALEAAEPSKPSKSAAPKAAGKDETKIQMLDMSAVVNDMMEELSESN